MPKLIWMSTFNFLFQIIDELLTLTLHYFPHWSINLLNIVKKRSFLTLILIRGCKNAIDLAYTFTHNYAKNSSQESVDPSFGLRKIVLSHYVHYIMFTQCLENALNSLDGLLISVRRRMLFDYYISSLKPAYANFFNSEYWMSVYSRSLWYIYIYIYIYIYWKHCASSKIHVLTCLAKTHKLSFKLAYTVVAKRGYTWPGVYVYANSNFMCYIIFYWLWLH